MFCGSMIQQDPADSVTFDPKTHLPSPSAKEGGRGEGVRREDLGPDLPVKVAPPLDSPGGGREVPKREARSSDPSRLKGSELTH